jgi:hypothetical protein
MTKKEALHIQHKETILKSLREFIQDSSTETLDVVSLIGACTAGAFYIDDVNPDDVERLLTVLIDETKAHFHDMRKNKMGA